MKIGSLFSGIGGLERGLELAGLGPVLWQCEIDPFCRTVLAHHYPEALRFEDVRSFVEEDEKLLYRSGQEVVEVPAVDIVCGGFP